MRPKIISQAQIGLLREIDRWGELSADAEHAAGCHGAAFNKVLESIIKRGWVEGDQTSGMRITDSGRKILATAA